MPPASRQVCARCESSIAMTPSGPTACAASRTCHTARASGTAVCITHCSSVSPAGCAAARITLQARVTPCKIPSRSCMGFAPAARCCAPCARIACVSTTLVAVPQPAVLLTFCAASHTTEGQNPGPGLPDAVPAAVRAGFFCPMFSRRFHRSLAKEGSLCRSANKKPREWKIHSHGPCYIFIVPFRNAAAFGSAYTNASLQTREDCLQNDQITPIYARWISGLCSMSWLFPSRTLCPVSIT